ncbi:TetR/AcrR family transcriptional regulator [Actinacidiphila acididurans]|uniref:TetR family transcriptional regulator n=1 Tax=Actinacidiphila acididurans TaxID=2784346 RepID=A0ABS2TLN3_9ACTN|nr:TetR family transcriptional regulator [Actinacidiphila acididurans]MBM9504246.1 TetR family transcriptional regulator [Actinacidiphila acididurans]
MARDGHSRRPGRPGKDTGAREAILGVARTRFLARGYDAVTLRSIAREAGVDPALISYYFGSKRGLFGAAMALVTNPAEAIAEALQGDPATFGPRALRTMLVSWDSAESGPALLGMLRRVAADDDSAALVREVLERELIDRVADRIGGPHARMRAMAFCTQMAGIIVTRYLLRMEPIASMPAEEVARLYGPAVRAALQDPVRRRPAGPAPASANSDAGTRGRG